MDLDMDYYIDFKNVLMGLYFYKVGIFRENEMRDVE